MADRDSTRQKHLAEAAAHGAKLLGSGKNTDYRRYLLQCGHEQEAQVAHMRIGNVKCQRCLDQKLRNEAVSQGAELLGGGHGKNYRRYRFECGHEQEVALTNMRIGKFKCKTCMEIQHRAEADQQGLELLCAGAVGDYRRYRFVACGHEQDARPDAVRAGSIQCEYCQDQKLRYEAAFHGAELLGHGKNCHYRKYRLACGHQQELQVSHMRTGGFLCQTCGDHAWVKPSYLYWIKITVDDFTWVKIGHAKNVQQRIKQYGLPSSAVVEVLRTVLYSSRLEADKAETAEHMRLTHLRRDPELMKQYHTKSGATECFAYIE